MCIRDSVATADWSNTMISWIVDIRRRERSKQEIADILSEFAVFVQYYPGTKDNEVLYDSLCDIPVSYTHLLFRKR